ncbi:galactokinase [Anaerotignum sp. MB30-C6]|uniref:galactokinase n=1 Tax=Anaerotignum sp. MB30-C6 TaxID=3070814 RepID=UPI0027DD8216|nr:galactokinase family protein [Anaerotignum sp. MB30-C6]WMI80987.1 galactokinase family protein [Anaerotignum sp. MB30-C6]
MGFYSIDEKAMSSAYPNIERELAFYQNRVQGVIEGFQKRYGKEPRIFSAPGRTEIGGNHTDHQHGCVLAAAVDLDILGAALPNGTKAIRVFSEGFHTVEVNIQDLSVREEEKNTSASLVRGIAAKMIEKGYPIEGFDLYATSNVLKGSGLSSSAAFEVLLGTVMNELFCGGKISPVDIATIGQYAENKYFGKMSGLMDQTASAVGGIVSIDFHNKAPIVKKLDFEFKNSGYSLCIIDSGADHADLSDQYSAIPLEMGQVAKELGAEVLRDIDPREFISKLGNIRKSVGDRAVFRALHFYRENQRAIDEAKRLAQGDFLGFLSLVNESGLSSLMYLQNVSVEGSVKNQEVLYALMACDILLDGRGAFRVHGGGFAGTVQAFVPNEMLMEFKNGIEAMVGEGSCHVLSIRMAGGIELTREG